MDAAHSKDLFRACEVLFGSEVDITHEFLRYIQLSGIRSAYRKVALLTHPDRRASTETTVDAEAFIEASWAYERLSDFIKVRDRTPRRVRQNRWRSDRADVRPFTHRRPPQREQAQGPKKPEPGFFRGTLPNRKLLFGEYLYYSRAITWNNLIQAIVWQRNQRPKLGELARTWGWLKEGEFRRITKLRRLGEPVGEALVRAGTLSRAQLNALLHSQRRLQKPLGEYCVMNALLTRQQLFRALHECSLHNRKHG